MDKYEYQVIMVSIHEIEQEQFHYLDRICKYLDCNIDMNREKIRERMLQLQEKKNKLNNYIK